MLRYCGNRIVALVLFLLIAVLARAYGGVLHLRISIVALMFWSYGFLETPLITVLNLSIYFVSH